MLRRFKFIKRNKTAECSTQIVQLKHNWLLPHNLIICKRKIRNASVVFYAEKKFVLPYLYGPNQSIILSGEKLSTHAVNSIPLYLANIICS